jgi:hypothetical protein
MADEQIEDTLVDGIPPPTEDAEVETDAASLAVEMGGNKMVPLSALIAAKKAGRAAEKRVKELEPEAARAAEINDRLGKAQPIIDAILTSPKLRAEALRIAQGTRTSDERTDQPDANEDPDAASYAEDAGFYLADGQTPDVARARRVLTRLDQRHGRQTDERIRPLAGVTLGNKADQNLRAIAAMTDDNGTPYATIESIREQAGKLPAHLLADPAVVDMVLNSAIGLDRRNGRTPKAPEEPLYLERQGGGGRREAAIDSSTKAQLARLGISEKDYAASSKRLEEGAANRRGITLGVK